MAKKGVSVGCDVQIKTQLPLQMIKDKFNKQAVKGLTMCGAKAEGYAKENIKKQKAVDTGNLRNSITYTVDKDSLTCYVGSSTEYAPYVELGTGKYYPGGRRGWWVYVIDHTTGTNTKTKKQVRSMKTYTEEDARRVVAILRSKGLDAHMTEGQEAKPFLKPAVADHVDEWNEIIENALKGK